MRPTFEDILLSKWPRMFYEIGLGNIGKIIVIATFVLVFIPFFSVQEAKATITLSDQSSCQALGGNWDPTNFVCVVSNLTLNAGDSLVISSGTTLSITGIFSNSASVSNSGSIYINP